MTLLPGLFDCHVHVVLRSVDTVERLQTPFSYPYYEAVGNMRATLDCGITTVRDGSVFLTDVLPVAASGNTGGAGNELQYPAAVLGGARGAPGP